MERYPEDTLLSLDSLRNAGWQQAVDASDGIGYPSLWQSFRTAAQTATANGHMTEGKGLWLLADACSMMLSPASHNAPFTAAFVFDGRRSALPEDFAPAAIDLFAAFVDEVDHPWLRARLADLVWLLRIPRDPRYALLAIDAYRQLPLDSDTWIAGSRDGWQRAISLSILLGPGAGDRLQDMEAALCTAFDRCTTADGYRALWFANLLATNKLGYDHRVTIATTLETLGRTFAQNGELFQARDIFAGAATWFQIAGDDAKAREMIVCRAETCVQEARANQSSAQPSPLVAAHFYECAIQIYRTIPRRHRAALGVDARIAELHQDLQAAGEQSVDDMMTITSSPIDIAHVVQAAQTAVAGKSVSEALLAFAAIFRGANVDRLRQSAQELVHRHPLQSLFPKSYRAADGRVTARRPAGAVGERDAGDDDAVIWESMISEYWLEIRLVVQGQILPALRTLRREHRITIDEFVLLVMQSPLVPEDRERLVGRALFAGYDGDMVSALHLLVPQIEHMVRWHLKQRGVKTTTLDKDGIETEHGLSTLLNNPEVQDIFGKHIAFELDALFCDPFGPNLRNELAHGLLSDDACESVEAIYAWWLGFRLVFGTLWNAVQSRSRPQSET